MQRTPSHANGRVRASVPEQPLPLQIEAGDRLIGEQDAAVLHQGTGNRNPLLLSARKCNRTLVFLFGKPNGRERSLRIFFRKSSGRLRWRSAKAESKVERPSSQFGQSRTTPREIELLEYDTDLAARLAERWPAKPL